MRIMTTFITQPRFATRMRLTPWGWQPSINSNCRGRRAPRTFTGERYPPVRAGGIRASFWRSYAPHSPTQEGANPDNLDMGKGIFTRRHRLLVYFNQC